jgi:nucleotidyltransferase substrate binding protein (TIGR01987 family)
MDQDIRWKQRFQNYRKALSYLTEAVELASSHGLSDMEQLSLIKAFEMSFELAWNVMKDYLSLKGITGIIGSRDAIRQAFKADLITKGEVWMDMIDSRNLASHTYDGNTANRLAETVIHRYYPEFSSFTDKIAALQDS